MAQPIPISTYESVLQRYHKREKPTLFDLIDSLRKYFPSKQALLVEDIVLDEFLADFWKVDLDAVRREWKGGLSWIMWDRPSEAKRLVLTEVRSGHLRVTWREVVFDVLRVIYATPYGEQQHWYALSFEGADDSAGRAFFGEVSVWNDRKKGDSVGRMLVFNQGFWTRDEKLADEIEGAKWEDLVLDGKVLKDLQENLKSFFNNGSLYDDLGVAWKRGVLLVGPPGNGKSQTIKLLVKESRHPCLYVKSTKGSRDVEDEECIMSIFKRARKSAPCLLVLEDLDSLIVDRTRTFFLNEMDGFARNHGILILASSNHPTRIEPAIRRPSRFDVVYLFEPPSFQLRCEYATKCLRKIHTLGKDTDLPSFKDLEGLAKAIAEETEGFSYAYMKELFLGFLLHFAHSGGENINDPKLLLLNHISNLKKQIEITIEEKEEEEEKEKEKEKVSDAGAPRRASSLIRCLRRLFL